MDIFSEIIEYAFLRNAIYASLLASLACGLTGAYIVSRRMVFLSGGISHASFGGIGLAFFVGIHPPLGALVFAVIAALSVEFLSKKQEIRTDSAIGIIWSVGMAIGIIFVYLTPGYVPNLMTYLFGNILTVSSLDLWLLGGSTSLAFVVFVLFYPTVLAVAFDESYARVRQLPVSLINYVLMAVVAITIVTSIRIAGVILVISFLTLPQAIAGIFTKRFSTMMIYSVLFSILGSFAGIYFSYLLDLPSGASIIFTFAVLFVFFRMAKVIHTSIRKGRKLETIA